MQGGNLDIISATEALSSWPVEDAVIVLFTGSDQSKFPAAGRGYNKIAQTIQTSTVEPTSEEPTTITITTTELYFPPICGFCILLDASVEGWETYPAQVEYMKQISLPLIQQAVAAPYLLPICFYIFGQGDSSVGCGSDYQWLITGWEELNRNVTIANAKNTTIVDQMAWFSIWQSCTGRVRQLALIFTNSGSRCRTSIFWCVSGCHIWTCVLRCQSWAPSASNGSIEALDLLGEQVALMREAAATMFKELQDLRFRLAMAGVVVGQSEYDIDYAFQKYTPEYWLYDYFFAVDRKNVTRLTALNHTIADTLATVRSEIYPDRGAAFFFSNSPQAEVDAIPTSDFRRQLYGYSLAGADLSRIAKPFQIPLAEDTIADFRDIFCLGPG
ncbi:unnamed protein product, partial [Mesorhabditis spiculigera]